MQFQATFTSKKIHENKIVVEIIDIVKISLRTHINYLHSNL